MKYLLALLALALPVSAQIGAVHPDQSITFGPYTDTQTIHLWIPDNPSRTDDGRVKVIVWDHGGGYRKRLPINNIGVSFNSADQYNAIRAMLHSALDMGCYIACVGATGSGLDSPPENTGCGLWRPVDPADTDPSIVHYYEEPMHASRAIDQWVLDQGETLPPMKAWCGISAGSMRALQATTPNVSVVVALNSPTSYPALVQTLPHVGRPYLRREGSRLDCDPYRYLGQASKMEQVECSTWNYAVQFQGPIFWGTDFDMQLLPGMTSPVNCDPIFGVQNALFDIHDPNQAASCFLERRASGKRDDVYLCEEPEAVGFDGEQTYLEDGQDEFPGGPQRGVRSSECMVEVLAFLKKNMDL